MDAIDLITEQFELYEMANLDSDDTGIDGMIIWVSVKNASHGPRVKVTLGEKVGKKVKFDASVSISDKPELKKGQLPAKQLKLVQAWVLKNKDVLLDLWNGKYTSQIKMAKDLQKI